VLSVALIEGQDGVANWFEERLTLEQFELVDLEALARPQVISWFVSSFFFLCFRGIHLFTTPL